MRLSEAIRLGSMLKPHGRGGFLIEEGTCAAGAALDACGELDADTSLSSTKHNQAFKRLFPIINALPATCPVCGLERAILWRWGGEFKLAHLNDQHEWTREAIADWIETIERRADAEGHALSTDAAAPAVAHSAPKDVLVMQGQTR